MEFSNQIKKFLMLGLVYVLMFHHVIPHHHHSHEEVNLELESHVHHSESQSQHSHQIHSHEFTTNVNNNSISKELSIVGFLHNIESPLTLDRYSKIRSFRYYQDNTFDFLLSLNHSLRAPPSIG